jgi:hypothetical protein
MPTPKELRSLYRVEYKPRNLTPLLETSGWLVWSGQTKGWKSAWLFHFYRGSVSSDYRKLNENIRGFAVRARR